MRLLQGAAAALAVGVIGWSVPVTAGAQTVCATLGGTVGADRLCEVHIADPNYLIDISLPVDYPEQQAVTDYLIQTRDGFVNVSQMPGSRGLPYALDARGTEYHSGEPTTGTHSLVFEVYQNVGGAHPSTWFKAFNYNLADNAPLGYDTVFDTESEPLEVIFPLVQRDLARQTGLDQPVVPEDGLNPANYQNFALTDDAVIFFFSQGELMPHAAGVTQATVPRSEVESLLTI